MKSILLTLLASLVFLSCTTSPHIDKEITVEINRSLTVSKDIAKWHVYTESYTRKDDYSVIDSSIIMNPFLWETYLTDDLTLLWFPLPLGMTYQFWNTSQSRFGISTAISFSNSSLNGFKLNPELKMSFRYKLNSKFAIDTKEVFNARIAFKSGENYIWSSITGVGPLYQHADDMAFRFNILYSVFRGGPYISTVDSKKDDVNFRLGAMVGSIINLGQQWIFEPDYTYYGINSKYGYQDQSINLNLTYLW